VRENAHGPDSRVHGALYRSFDENAKIVQELAKSAEKGAGKSVQMGATWIINSSV